MSLGAEAAPETGLLLLTTVFCGSLASLIVAVAVLGGSGLLANLTTLTAFCVLAIVNYWIGERNVLYPGFIFAALWTFTYGLYTLVPIDVDQIGRATQFLLIGCVVSFSVGSLFGIQIPTGLRPDGKGQLPDGGRILMVICLLVVLPLFFRDIVNLAGGFGPDLISRARLAMIETALRGEDAYSSRIDRAAPNVAVLCALAVAIDWKRSSMRVIAPVVVLIALIYAVLTTGRPQIVQLIGGLGAIWLWHKGEFRLLRTVRHLAIPIVCGGLLLALIPLLTKAQASEASSGAEFAGTLFLQYIVGSIPALDVLIRTSPVVAHSFTYHSLLLGWNGLLGHSTEELQNWFVFVPFPMNTYTAYRPYLFDFGIAGPILFACAAGVLHGALFRLARSGSAPFLFLYAAYLSPLLMTIFDDLYTGQQLAHHFEIMLFCLLYFGVLRDLSIRALMRRAASIFEVAVRPRRLN